MADFLFRVAFFTGLLGFRAAVAHPELDAITLLSLAWCISGSVPSLGSFGSAPSLGSFGLVPSLGSSGARFDPIVDFSTWVTSLVFPGIIPSTFFFGRFPSLILPGLDKALFAPSRLGGAAHCIAESIGSRKSSNKQSLRCAFCSCACLVAISRYDAQPLFWRSRAAEPEEQCEPVENLQNGLVVPRAADFIMLRSGKARAAASVGSTPRTSLRSGHGSVGESDIVICSQRVQEMIQRLERVLLAFDMVKNRSEKDSKRAELLSSVVDRLRILGTDITRIAQECGYEKDALSSEDTCKFIAK
ncbi:unnamed protein product [Gongylonema pulchrum]|uniref:BAG domain-containing protein n=1 Tax=Gongylonema pulchrum TaxID=637853 RepID=A0A183E9V8_9BILA|nr:unnamed protein product [Gongylonema pulchrum]